jgi:polyribonucleotide nucleotidyltransferase
VAGIAMGLITDQESGNYTVLSDIQGMEDALGDMDFKVAGTAEGVTAIQMDIKVKGITIEIMRQALEQANAGRAHILGKMLESLEAPRSELSPYAPRVLRIKVNPEKIGLIIGPGGKNIRSLQEETNTKIDIDDDGTVSIASVESAGAEAAVQRILGMTQEYKIDRGEIYTGKVVSVMPFGAFVELLPGKDGLVHISELSEDPAIRVNRVEDVVNVGDEVTVMVIDVAPNGKVSLSRRAALTGELPEPKPERGPRPGGDRGGFDRGPRPGGDRGGFDRGPRPGGDRGPRRDDGGDRGPRPEGGGDFANRPEGGGDFANRPADSRRRPPFGGDE